jgi:hypothetical protein
MSPTSFRKQELSASSGRLCRSSFTEGGAILSTLASWFNMSDYSAVAPPTNFSQSSAFAAALQRARQVFNYGKLNFLERLLD